MKWNVWKVTYKQNGKEKGTQCFSKKEMVKEYIIILDRPIDNITELKIFKNDKDYTETLNKFLYN